MKKGQTAILILLRVTIALDKDVTSDIIKPGDFLRKEESIVDAATFEVNLAPSDSFDQHIVCHFETDHLGDLDGMILHHFIETCRLLEGARIAVDDHSVKQRKKD